MILQDRIYYFEQISQPEEADVVFELKALELGSVMNRISTGLQVSNASPRILGADAEGRVLFSFGILLAPAWGSPTRSARRTPDRRTM